MPIPTIDPISTTSTAILTSTGSVTLVNEGVALGVYSDPTSPLYSINFLSGAADQVKLTYRMIGGDVLDLEIKPANVYAAYEKAVLTYSRIVNIHQAKNVLGAALGNMTGTFDHDGNLQDTQLSASLSGSHVGLKFPKFDFGSVRRVWDRYSTAARAGGTMQRYSASMNVIPGTQDYDLQAAVSGAAASGNAAFTDAFMSSSVRNPRVLIDKVYYKTPRAMWRFFGMYGGLSVVGNLSNYGQYSDDSTFELIPTWQNKLQAKAYESAIYTRTSHYSYELIGNKVRLYPPPTRFTQSSFWFTFVIPTNIWEEDSDDRSSGIDGINNFNTLPFGNLPYDNINSIGKDWIRDYALALTKEILGHIRGKFRSIPIPGDSVELDWAELFQQAKEEKDALITRLREDLDALTYLAQSEKEAKISETAFAVVKRVPMAIYVG